VSNPSVPPDLETICLKCLNKGRPPPVTTPRKPWPTTWNAGSSMNPSRPRPVNPPEKLWRWCRRKPAGVDGRWLCTCGRPRVWAGISWQWGRARQSAREAQIAQRQTTTSLWIPTSPRPVANRRSGQPGQSSTRSMSSRGPRAIKSSPELRDEAVQLSLWSNARRVFRRADLDAAPTITALTRHRRRYAAVLTSGEISIRSADDSSELFRLPATVQPWRASNGSRRTVVGCWRCTTTRWRACGTWRKRRVRFGSAHRHRGGVLQRGADRRRPVPGLDRRPPGGVLGRGRYRNGTRAPDRERSGEHGSGDASNGPACSREVGTGNGRAFRAAFRRAINGPSHPPYVRKVNWDSEGRFAGHRWWRP